MNGLIVREHAQSSSVPHYNSVLENNGPAQKLNKKLSRRLSKSYIFWLIWRPGLLLCRLPMLSLLYCIHQG